MEPTEVSGMVLFSYRAHRSFQVRYLPTRATAGLVVSAPRTSPRRLGVRVLSQCNSSFVITRESLCHRPWTFPFVYQDLKSSKETPIRTLELPEKMYPTILCAVKCPMIRLQRYSTLQKPISGYQPQVGSDRVALINIAVRTLGNG